MGRWSIIEIELSLRWLVRFISRQLCFVDRSLSRFWSVQTLGLRKVDAVVVTLKNMNI